MPSEGDPQPSQSFCSQLQSDGYPTLSLATETQHSVKTAKVVRVSFGSRSRGRGLSWWEIWRLVCGGTCCSLASYSPRRPGNREPDPKWMERSPSRLTPPNCVKPNLSIQQSQKQQPNWLMEYIVGVAGCRYSSEVEYLSGMPWPPYVILSTCPHYWLLNLNDSNAMMVAIQQQHTATVCLRCEETTVEDRTA